MLPSGGWGLIVWLWVPEGISQYLLITSGVRRKIQEILREELKETHAWALAPPGGRCAHHREPGGDKQVQGVCPGLGKWSRLQNLSIK